MEGIKIKKVTLHDIWKLQKIGKETFSETFSSSNTEENMKKYLNEGFSNEKLSAELNSENSEFYFALSENNIIGYLKVNFGASQTELKDDKSLEIERIYVLKEFHGKKVGQILYEQAIDIAKQKNADYVWLENPRAISFYKKNGFKEFDKHIFKLGHDEQTDIMMKLKLKTKTVDIHFVQHEVFEAPGAYLEWAKARKHTITFSKVYENQPLPDTADHIDMLIVMGGPQSPDTTKEECPHFDAAAEKALIQKAINAGKVVIGICLGAQLIGEALGAACDHSPEKEIGVFPIQLTADGQKDEKVNHFGSTLHVGHWHNDMPGLTSRSKILATSIGCPRQIVAYSNLVYGFQCHMEFTTELVELLIAEEVDFLTNNTTHKYVQKPDEIRNYDFNRMNEKLFQFLDKLVMEYASNRD